MKVRKNYLLVKVPTGVHETGQTKRSPKPQVYQQDIAKSSIHINQNPRIGLKFSVQEFPDQNRSFSIIHGRSNSEIRSNMSPIKLQKYVESILDNKRVKSSFLKNRNQSSFSRVKPISNNLRRGLNMRSRLLPLFLQLKGNLN